nr:hypothetical protein [Leuconostoc mesenteroides]
MFKALIVEVVLKIKRPLWEEAVFFEREYFVMKKMYLGEKRIVM